jgi:uncharacterized phage protein gp47/JayE
MADNVRFLTWQEVLDQMLSFLPPQWRANFTGKLFKRLLVAFSLSMEGLYGFLSHVLRMSILATSEGQWLRQLVAGFGMSANAGIAAVAAVRFERYGATTTAVTIPAGTAAQTSGGLIFTTNSSATLAIAQSSTLVVCTCSQPGTVGNVTGGSINALRSPIVGIDNVINLDPAVGGADPEADASIKARVPQHLAMLHRATIPATEAAILGQPALFPSVVSFITERRSDLPGYVRGVLADASGGDLFRPGTWQTTDLPGTYYVVTSQTPQGLIEVGWPCKRFGVVSQATDGSELWNPSDSAVTVSQGNYRWFYDTSNNRLYARGNGGNLNSLEMVIYAGVVWQAVQELETKWVAAGVGVDVIVPTTSRVAFILSYALEPGYTASTVEAALAAAVNSYVGTLRMGQTLEVEALYGVLGGVPGAGGVLLISPATNVTVERGYIIRVASVQVIRRG